MAQEVLVLKPGTVVEHRLTENVLDLPKHPHTRLLSDLPLVAEAGTVA